jgi:glycosyltransferase involved in cell wall biosynthesis
MSGLDRAGNRIGVVSHVLPPAPSGQAVVLYRLLAGTPPERYFLISRENYEGGKGADSASEKLPGRYYRLAPPFAFRLPGVPLLSGRAASLNAWIAIRSRARQIARIARKEHCGALIGCTGDLYDLPATAIAGRWTGLPVILYLFDDYVHQWTGPSRKFAASLEPGILRAARAVIVPNEHAQAEYARRYGVRGTIVRNLCPIPDLAEMDGAERAFEPGASHIVYAGAVYHAQGDAFRNLIAAIGRTAPGRIRLHVYTAQSPAELEGQGIHGPMVVHHPHIPQSGVAAVLRQADVLFLPLAFRSPIQEVIRTSAPGKMGEYLAVGRPILVHAPGDSFVAWYFRTNGCGVVADLEDPEDLAAALDRLCTDPETRRSVSIAARAAAERDYDLDKVRSSFETVIREVVPRNGRGTRRE